MLSESPVLVGLVPVSKLYVFGLAECGDAVVEFANHIFESFPTCCTEVPDDEVLPVEPADTIGLQVPVALIPPLPPKPSDDAFWLT